MEWQRQDAMECFPTSIAMLAGVSKDEVIQDASRRFFGHSYFSWPEIRRSTSGAHRYVLDRWTPWITASEDELMHGAYRFNSLEDDFHGRGLALWKGRYGGYHATAFENGQIYDPDCGIRSPQSLFDDGWTLIGIQREPTKDTP